jgi:hypothetical protein
MPIISVGELKAEFSGVRGIVTHHGRVLALARREIVTTFLL